jgi:hypothetical protein
MSHGLHDESACDEPRFACHSVVVCRVGCRQADAAMRYFWLFLDHPAACPIRPCSTSS